ncbi:hypothetical protein M406DRAFT_69280 [Cryphonectria parasitica EP155]|uniref:Uncharacterized protein n=1 Tax=Cryphonectria parasitica (strain ATCC 38755 / EP155) TaxID=660469 RepID=A0A9P4Y5L8_CRYP1|nr:uncharacterized protein M406DRAFT_69280 [Cryphonectria parasitica EP155]KAF3767116.1 hypothetical protein M406DRAFT_69280 [Cryphonectria parasitica EP155]
MPYKVDRGAVHANSSHRVSSALPDTEQLNGASLCGCERLFPPDMGATIMGGWIVEKLFGADIRTQDRSRYLQLSEATTAVSTPSLNFDNAIMAALSELFGPQVADAIIATDKYKSEMASESVVLCIALQAEYSGSRDCEFLASVYDISLQEVVVGPVSDPIQIMLASHGLLTRSFQRDVLCMDMVS